MRPRNGAGDLGFDCGVCLQLTPDVIEKDVSDARHRSHVVVTAVRCRGQTHNRSNVPSNERRRHGRAADAERHRPEINLAGLIAREVHVPPVVRPQWILVSSSGVHQHALTAVIGEYVNLRCRWGRDTAWYASRRNLSRRKEEMLAIWRDGHSRTDRILQGIKDSDGSNTAVA